MDERQLWSDIHYFDAKEFESPDEPGSGFRMNLAFVRKLDQLRQAVKHPLVIRSGYRTVAHNKEVGGRADSAHLTGHAVDIGVDGAAMRYHLLEAALRLGFRRIGIGPSFVHLDDALDRAQDVCWLYPELERRSG